MPADELSKAQRLRGNEPPRTGGSYYPLFLGLVLFARPELLVIGLAVWLIVASHFRRRGGQRYAITWPSDRSCAKLQPYVQTVGHRVARASHQPTGPWHFVVTAHSEAGAWVLESGHIFVTRGLLPYLSDEAELAGVLAHEVAHVTLRHSDAREQVTKAGFWLLPGLLRAHMTERWAQRWLHLFFFAYMREQELAADALGAAYVARAGWDPSGCTRAMRTLGLLAQERVNKDPSSLREGLSTHPAHSDRVAHLKATVSRLNIPSLDTGCEAYRRHISGVPLGDVPGNRIGFYRVRDGDTWETIAVTTGREPVDAPRLALLNGQSHSTVPPVGADIKIVEAAERVSRHDSAHRPNTCVL